MKKFFSFFAAMLMAVSMVAAESELLYELTTSEVQGSNNSYAGNCDIEVNNITWNFTGNSQINPWRIGGKSLAAVEREVYTKTAYPVELDSVCLYLGNNTLTSLDGVKLVYSTNADFSEAMEVVATVPEKFPATVTFAVEGVFPAKAYYKFVLTCTVSGNSNKYIQFNGVDFWGVMPVVAVTNPVFSVAAGSYYDAQTVELSCETDGAEIRYTLDGTEPTATSALYAEALTISETTTVKAIAIKGADKSEEVSKTYEIAKQYASLADLVNEAGAPAGQKVVVTLTNDKIDSLYVSSGKKVNGVYLTAAGRMVEIYCYDVPKEWEVGGTISGTVKGEWKNYNGTWEVCPSTWDGITYTAPAAEWDGTVTLSEESFSALSELEGLTLTFNGATTLALLDAEGSMVALQNEDGSEMYAAWSPGMGGTYTIDGAVVTLGGWYAADGETAPLPAASATLYIEDYGSFIVDGDDEAYFETAEIAFETAGPTTYTVTYTVNGFDAEHCLVQAGYFDEEETVGGEFIAGENTVPENVFAYISTVVLDDYTVEVKVNGEAVTLIDGMWYSDDVITADMTIEVTFTAPGEKNPWASVYTTSVEFTTGTNSYLNEKINIGEEQYAAVKIGTAKNTGNCTLTVPAGAQHLYIHATGWSLSETTTMTISGAGLDVTETLSYYLGISGNSPYTVAEGRDASKAFFDYEFAAPLAEAAVISLTGNGRIVFFGVNTDKTTPTALQNVEAVKVVKTIENGQLIIIRDGVRYNVVGAKF